MKTERDAIRTILRDGETLTVEFKSDQKSGLSDRDLVAAVVSLANTEGGELFLGVEDNGSITGIQQHHQDSVGLIALIANAQSSRGRQNGNHRYG